MDYLWWQMCLIILCKGLAWVLPIFSVFFAVSWFITDLTREIVEKKKFEVHE
jgi:hypothetical protein